MHKKIKKHHLAFLTVACIALSLAFFTIYLGKRPSHAGAVTACTQGFTMGVSSSSGTTAGQVSGVANVVVGVPTTAVSVSKVMIWSGSIPLGMAAPNGTYSWSMPWITTLHPNGAAALRAEISTGQGVCAVGHPTVNVFNGTAANLNNVPNPPQWKGPMSFSVPFIMTTTVPTPNITSQTFDATKYAIYSWRTSIGSISSFGNKAQFSSGGTVGNGSIIVTVRYGGRVMDVPIPITVASESSPLPSLSTSSTSTSTTSTTTASTTATAPTTTATGSTTTTANRTAALQNNPVTQSCVAGIVGEKQFTEINTGAVRPKIDVINKLKVCFASSNYILPSNFAPVAPKTIKKLEESKSVAVGKLENVTTKKGDTSKEALKLKGKANPKETVFIYIFSDPLVLTTTADADGNWEYTLEDPLESGEHEVYTVVDRGNGKYERSSPVSFFIGTASAEDNNPGGLSLKLGEEPTPTQSNRSFILYAVGAVVAVLVVLTTLTLVIRHRHKKAKLLSQLQVPSTEPEMPVAPASPAPLAPVTAPAAVTSTIPPTPVDASPMHEPQVITPDTPPTDQSPQNQ